MHMVTEADVLAKWQQIQGDNETLLFLVGGAGSGKSKILRDLSEQDGWKLIEAKDLIDEEFLEYAREERPEKAPAAVSATLRACNGKVVLIDSVQVLFSPILNIPAFELLKRISTQFPLIVGWRGSFDGKQLHLEHCGNEKYASFDVEYPEHIMEV